VRVPGPDAVEILITSIGDRDDHANVHTRGPTGLRARRARPTPHGEIVRRSENRGFKYGGRLPTRVRATLYISCYGSA
jgi:hypothetical protein